MSPNLSFRAGVMKGVSWVVWVCIVLCPLVLAAAEPDLGVGGIVNKSINKDRVSFCVTNLSGYVYGALLDGNPVPVGTNVTVTVMDYHELWVSRTNLATSAVTNRVVQFIIIDSQRVGTEEGIAKMIPLAPIYSGVGEFAGGQLDLMVPASYPPGLEIPVVAWVRKSDGTVPRVNGLVDVPGQTSFDLLRGSGSGFLPATNSSGLLDFTARVGGVSAKVAVKIEPEVQWRNVGGIISGAVEWPENSRICITNTLTIDGTATLNVGPGSVVLVNPAVDIYLNGRLRINGVTNSPVIFTPVARELPWGGLIISNSAELTATASIFVGAGRDQCWYGYHQADRCSTPGRPHSHRPEQSLFHCETGATVTLTDCAAIYLAGQFGHSVGAVKFNITRQLIQRCASGGEYDSGASIRMNDSVMVEVPLAADYWVDGDNDGFYLNSGGHAFTNCVIGWTKDDCIDSGGSGSGTNYFINCWFENPLHEGVAGSGGGKYNFVSNTVAIHCGQGFEVGYDRVTNHVANCIATDCMVGSRMSDNYYSGYTHNGRMQTFDSLLLFNRRNVWGMEYTSTGWTYQRSQMEVQGGFLSQLDTNWPSVSVWDPAVDAARLAPFITIPQEAAVGVAFGTFSNMLSMAKIWDGIPICLSHFTTHPVTVDFTLKSDGVVLTNGTVTFVPGQVTQWIKPSGFNPFEYGAITASLAQPNQGELTGLSNLVYVVPPTFVNLAVDGPQVDMASLEAGVPVALSATSAVPVSVDYSFGGSRGVLGKASLTFAPGEGTNRIFAPSALSEEVVRVQLSQPVHAELGNLTEAFYLWLPSEHLVRSNSWWRYLDTGANAGTAWRELGYDDHDWKYGKAQLGFGDNDEATKINLTSGINGYVVTHYFRQKFYVEDPAAFTNLLMRVLRDDGAVVYLNGSEVFRTANMPAWPTAISYTTLANITNAAENTVDWVNVPASNLVRGINVVAVEVHQHDTSSSDVSFDLALTASPSLPLRNRLLKVGGDLLFYWPDESAVMLEADEVGGPWRPTGASNSPVRIAPENQSRFYRLKR